MKRHGKSRGEITRSQLGHQFFRVIATVGVIALIGAATCGCDPALRHEVLSTIFDGVPTLPPKEEYCAQQSLTQNVEHAVNSDQVSTTSEHPPYAEKKCPSCHDTNNEATGGLVKPPNELCFVCHENFLTGSSQHGPAAVGDCLACHLPHTSGHRSLLLADPGKICAKCHQEQRLTANMHTRLEQKGLTCIECHDPHSGPGRYFLK